MDLVIAGTVNTSDKPWRTTKKPRKITLTTSRGPSNRVDSQQPAALLPTVAPCSQQAALSNTYSGKEVVNVVAGNRYHADICVMQPSAFLSAGRG